MRDVADARSLVARYDHDALRSPLVTTLNTTSPRLANSGCCGRSRNGGGNHRLSPLENPASAANPPALPGGDDVDVGSDRDQQFISHDHASRSARSRSMRSCAWWSRTGAFLEIQRGGHALEREAS